MKFALFLFLWGAGLLLGGIGLGANIMVERYERRLQEAAQKEHLKHQAEVALGMSELEVYRCDERAAYIKRTE